MITPRGCTHMALHAGQTCEQYEAGMAAWEAANAGHRYSDVEIAAFGERQALDAELLAWAKKKAVSPFEWGPGGIRVSCSFCGWVQAVRWDGGLEAHHNDGCLAVRANGGAK